jgi:hypothetical protein
VNGWNNSVDNNSGKSAIVSLTLKPTSAFSFIENYMGGPELTGTNKGMRNLSDTTITYTASKQVSLAANGDFGKQAAGGGLPSQTWWGVAGYAKFQANDVVAISPRLEYLNDEDGFMTGTVQKLKEATITYEAKSKDGFLFRAEYRHDMSDQAFFTKKGATKKNQDTLTFGIVYAFSSMH